MKPKVIRRAASSCAAAAAPVPREIRAPFCYRKHLMQRLFRTNRLTLALVALLVFAEAAHAFRTPSVRSRNRAPDPPPAAAPATVRMPDDAKPADPAKADITVEGQPAPAITVSPAPEPPKPAVVSVPPPPAPKPEVVAVPIPAAPATAPKPAPVAAPAPKPEPVAAPAPKPAPVVVAPAPAPPAPVVAAPPPPPVVAAPAPRPAVVASPPAPKPAPVVAAPPPPAPAPAAVAAPPPEERKPRPIVDLSRPAPAVVAAAAPSAVAAAKPPAAVGKPDPRLIENIFACLSPGLPNEWKKAWIVLAEPGPDRKLDAKFFYAVTAADDKGEAFVPCNAKAVADSVYGLNDLLAPEQRRWRAARLVITSEGDYELKYDYAR